MIYQNEINRILIEINSTHANGLSTPKNIINKTARGALLLERLRLLACKWIASGGTREEKRVAARWVYWYLEFVDVPTIAQALGSPSNQAMIKEVGPFRFKLKCINCGGLKETFFVSRARKRTGTCGPYGVTLYTVDRGLCDNCIALDRERKKRESQARQRVKYQEDMDIISGKKEASPQKRYWTLVGQMNPTQEQLLKEMPYQEFLRTNYWSIVRAYKLYKEHYKCKLCSKKQGLQIHHRTYENKGKEYDKLDDLIALCANCHAKFHDKLPN